MLSDNLRSSFTHEKTLWYKAFNIKIIKSSILAQSAICKTERTDDLCQVHGGVQIYAEMQVGQPIVILGPLND